MSSQRIQLRLLAVSLAIGGPSAAFAADVSPWDNDTQSAARLVAAQASNASGVRTFRAGVEIKLKPGWKTYWRYPGDSGVPPVLDFSKSENVSGVTVLYPAPALFADGAGGRSIGYKGDVMLPIHVRAQDDGRPVLLRLKLDYAVCENLCVPAQANLELALMAGSGSAQDGTVAAAEARVPKPAQIGDGGAPAIRAARRESGTGKPRIVVDVAAPPGEALTLLAEGPNAQWALPLPEPVAGAPAGQQRFSFELVGLPPGETASGATLRLTAIAGSRAVEAAFRLD
jgi:DsbC/DsbD-like thiol-disulfide interchange protein